MAAAIRPDICVIGSGPGAFAVAAAGATFGAHVVVVAKDGLPGAAALGETRRAALAAVARQASAMRAGAPLGIAAAEPEIDFKRVARHVREAVAGIQPNGSAERLSALGVQVIRAEPRFSGRDTLVAGDRDIRARRYVIAVGSTPVMPAIEGLADIEPLSEATVFDLSRRPVHLVVFGSGAFAVETAQAWRLLGAEVTLVAGGPVLPGSDREAAALIVARLKSDGVAVHEAAADRVERRSKSGVRIHLAGLSAIDATHVLVAAGSTPDLAGLDLAAARVKIADGLPVLGKGMRTSNGRIHAIGNAAGGRGSAALAAHHAGIAIRAILLRSAPPARPAIVPRLVMTDPELAEVGMDETMALKAGAKVHVFRWPLADAERAVASKRTTGNLKVFADGGGRILGAVALGEGAAEAINVWALALSKDMRLSDMAGWVPAHPTAGEIGKRAAMSYLAAAARKPSVRRLIRALRFFG